MDDSMRRTAVFFNWGDRDIIIQLLKLGLGLGLCLSMSLWMSLWMTTDSHYDAIMAMILLLQQLLLFNLFLDYRRGALWGCVTFREHHLLR